MWSQADGWAGQQEQTGHHMESLKKGWRADSTCILHPGGYCNVLPVNDPVTACNAMLQVNNAFSFKLNKSA